MSNKYKILLVEDEANIRTLVSTMLETAGYQSIQAGTCEQGILMVTSHMPDLVILDLGLPDRDGMDFIHAVRENFLMPIIVLSARTDEEDKVAALDAGANDYVTKPFGSAELLARVRSALRSARRGEPDQWRDQRFTLQDLTIDYAARQVFLGDREIRLTQTEYNILALLSENCGKMMSYRTIIHAIWGYTDDGSVKKLQVNMANIRKKIGACPGEDNYIINEIGVGYRMNGNKQ